ncbi:MAG: hypothetical protein R3D88_06420 [Alphaproteobacteria bacterium]
MAKAQFTYAVGLVPDHKIGHRQLTYTQSLSLLKDFLAAHDGQYLGPFKQDEMDYPEYAVVKMGRKAEEALQKLSEDLHLEEGKQPFVERLEGLVFDICLENGMVIHPPHIPYQPECTCST